MPPKISVVTVVFNAAATLEQTMLSVLDQQYPDLEYILIDGGSTDGSIEIIKKYQERLAYWVSEPDHGISDAFNKGIAIATGDLIGILNADDWYQPDTLQKVAQVWESQKPDLIHGNQQYWVKNSQGEWEKDYVFTARQEALVKEMTINHPTVFVARRVYEELGTFRLDMRYAMDYELVLRFWLAGKQFYYLPLVLANMRLDGASDRNWKKAYQESLRAKLINGINRYEAYLYYWKVVLRTFTARTLNALGLGMLVRWFRANFALTPKSK